MPAHNEQLYLEGAVREVHNGLMAENVDFEIVLVENGSLDDTRSIAEQLEATFAEVRAISLPQADYGNALRRGVLEAKGESVVIFDVDYLDLDFLREAVDLFSGVEPPAIVVGSKRATGARDNRSFLRRLATAGFTSILRYGFGLSVSDTHGIKALNAASVLPMVAKTHSRRELWDTELILRTERAGLQVVEVPVIVEETRPSRTSILQRIPRTIFGLVRLRIQLWRESR